MVVLKLNPARNIPPPPSPASTGAPSVVVEMRGRTAEAFQWPAPPFHLRAPESPPGQDGEAELEFTDGHVVTGELVSMHAGGATVTLRLPEQDAPQQVNLAQVRRVQLKKPLAFVPNTGTLRDLGASSAQVAGEKPFTVVYPDGTRFAGQTRGFLKCSHGLYLFLAGTSPELTLSCFIPRLQLSELVIGQPLGETLQEKGLVDRETLNTVLDQQVQQRGELLGEFLTGQAIVTTEGLMQALKQQATRPNVRLGDLLVESKLIKPEQLTKALAIQAANRKRRLGDILVSMGLVTVRMIQMALSEKLGIPHVNVRDFTIDPAALRLVNGRFAIRNQVLPLLRTAESLVVAVENPLNIDFEQELRFAAGLAIIPVIGDPDEIRARITTEYRVQYSGSHPAHVNAEDDQRRSDAELVKVEELAFQLAQELPQPVRSGKASEAEARVTDNTLVKLVNKMIGDAHAHGASDIHIESNPNRGNTRIRFRKDGDMVDYLELQPAYRSALVSRIKIMAGLDISERRRSQDGKIRFGRFGSVPIELRVAIIPTVDDHEDVVLRLLGGAEPKPIEDLALSNRDLDEIRKIVGRSYGLMLVCGPTGSGKTTTLHSMLRHINRPDLKIWTAEDPIEITQPGLRQVQVNDKIGWTFADAMRTFLRADPDVIMVGEMRDAETAKVGIEASLTGHLVLSTLHTNTAAESITRLLNLGMNPFNFADTLLGVLSQRLARRLCPHCKRPHLASETELTDLANEYCDGTRLDPVAVLKQWRTEFGHHGQLKLHTASGCDKCSNGHKGRLGVYELLVASPQVKQLIRTSGTAPQLVEAAQAGGMRSLKQDALLKVLSGELDLTSARAVFN